MFKRLFTTIIVAGYAVASFSVSSDTLTVALTGDIMMGEYRGAACAYLFALDEIADYIAASLERAGHAALKVSVAA